MGTYTRSHSFTSGEKPTEAQWNVDIDGLITLCNGQIDKANVDSSSTDGIVTMDEAQTVTGRKAFSGNIAAELTIDTVANAAGSVQDVLTLEWDPGDGANLTDNSSGISLLYKMPDDADNQDDFAALTCMVVSDATGSEEGEFSFRLVKAGTLTEIATLAPTTGLTVGVDGTGYDVKFFGDTSGQYMLWDQSADELVLAGDSKLSFHDAAGGENIIASSDGHLEVNAGTTLDITAPTVDLNSSTKFNIDTAAYDLNASGAVTIDSAGVSIDSSAASNLTTSGGALTITSAAAATWSTAAGALTINGTGGVNVQEGGATIIGISDSRVLSTSNTASIDMDATGAVQINSSGGAISVANDNVDQTVNLATAGTRTLNIGILDGTDTTTITSKGNQTHSGTITVGVDNTGYDVKFFGDTSGSSLLWDESADDLIFTNAGIAVGSDATGDVYYRNASGFLARLAAGSNADVLTLASGVPSWATPTTGDITGVTAGNGLSGGGTSGGVTLALALSELTDTAIANGDYIVFTDTTDSGATVKGDLADVATLFAGTGLTASSSVIGVDASQTQITAVGTIATGTWQGTKVASAYLDDDTAHLSGTQTFSGAKTFGSADLFVANGNGMVIGHTAQITSAVGNAELQVLGTTNADAAIDIGRFSANGQNGTLSFIKGRGGIGDATALNSGDYIGVIQFYGADGNDLATSGANISVVASGTIAENRIPTYMTFSTGTDAAPTVVTEAMRITSGQDVGIGTNAPGSKLEVKGAGSTTYDTANMTDGMIQIMNTDGGTANSGVAFVGSHSATGTLISGMISERDNASNWGTNVIIAGHPFDTSDNDLLTPIAYFLGNGNVGIGTATPASILTIRDSSPIFQFQDSTHASYGNYICASVGNLHFGQNYHDGSLTCEIMQVRWGGGRNVCMFGGLIVAGAVSKGSGSFRIDHPLESKKDTHQLVHSFIEGPQADLMYRGVVQLVDGSAQINIDTVSDMTDGTFVALNRCTQVFTTNESNWDAVRGSVTGNILTIESNTTDSTACISWMVVGERCDQHMMDTAWTHSDGRVIVEPENEVEPEIE